MAQNKITKLKDPDDAGGGFTPNASQDQGVFRRNIPGNTDQAATSEEAQAPPDDTVIDEELDPDNPITLSNFDEGIDNPAEIPQSLKTIFDTTEVTE